MAMAEEAGYSEQTVRKLQLNRSFWLLVLVFALAACGGADEHTTADAPELPDTELLPHVFQGPSSVVDDLPADVKAFCVGYEQALQGNPYSGDVADNRTDAVILAQYLSWNLATRQQLVAPDDIAEDFDLLNENFQGLIDFIETNDATLEDFAGLSDEDSAFFDKQIEQKFDAYWWGTCLDTESPYPSE